MSDARRTFLFMPESAYGPTNNCIGIGNELLKRGHRVVFAAERSWQGKLAALGFEEDLVDLTNAHRHDSVKLASALMRLQQEERQERVRQRRVRRPTAHAG